MPILSKPFALLSSALLVTVSTVFSLCAGGDWDWYEEHSILAPEAIVQDKSYEQLFYTLNMFYGENWYDEMHPTRFKSAILSDWKTYLKSKISDKELEYYIFDDKASNDIASIIKAIKANDGKGKWATKLDLKNPSVRQFFLFINLARSLETYTNNVADWDYDAQAMTEQNSMSLNQAKEIESIYQITKDPFLKSKYWLLTMKSYFYSVKRNSCIGFFNKTQSTLTRDESYYRGVAYVAGAMYKDKQYAESNFMYALVFDNCPKLRTVATYCFHPQNDSDFEASLSLAKTNDQKAALWALYGYYANEVTALEKVYDLNPQNQHLDYLLSRAMNLAEEKINATEWNYYGSDSKVSNDSLNAELYSHVVRIAKAGTTKNPYVWNMAAGYLETVKGNYQSAAHFLAEAEKSIPNTKLTKVQLKLFQVFNDIASVKTMDATTEAKLLPKLQWLFNLSKVEGEDSRYRIGFLHNWSRTYIAKLYKNQGNDVFSELFLRKEDFYDDEKRMIKMQQYLSENHTTDWDNFAKSLYSVTLDDIHEYKAIRYAYADQIPQAIAEMEQSGKNKEDILLGNPFNGNIKDCNDCDHYAKQKTKYSKLNFLKKLNEIQTILKGGGDTYNEAILVGNAFYNMSFYGNARLFYNNEIIHQYGTNYIDKKWSTMLESDQRAAYYYQKALTFATNDEQRAKAVYMLTKIERNAFYATDAFKPYEVDFIAFNGYKTLASKFAHTQYYQEVINECDYFRKYAQK